VGVVGDVRQSSPAPTPEPELYMPFQQHPYHANELQVVLRTEGNAALLTPAAEQRMRQLSPTAAVKFSTMEAMVSDSIATPRFRTFLVGLFAGIALLLAMAGIYGVMNYLVTQRTSEFGLRMALGANAGDVLSSTMGQAFRLTAVGLAMCVALSFAAHRLLESMLFGLKPMDVATYAAVLVVVFVVACTAAGIPAWRATRIDPIVALRNE
jgi:putative ABC transport system permease protein